MAKFNVAYKIKGEGADTRFTEVIEAASMAAAEAAVAAKLKGTHVTAGLAASQKFVIPTENIAFAAVSGPQ